MQLFRNIASLTDEQLVELYKKNDDKRSFGELYQRYAHLVFGTCMKYLKSNDDAQDMTGFIFEKLMQELKKKQVNNFRSWLYRVSVNECLMKLRKEKKEVYLNPEYTVPEEESELETKSLNEEKLLELEEAIKLLKPDQQKCIELFYLKQLSYQQIVEETKLELKKVKSYIQNGKRNLKLILEKKLIFKEQSHGF